MRELNLKTVKKYFLYTVLVVCVFLVVYGLGTVVCDDLNWIVNGYVNSPRQNGMLIILFIMTSLLSLFIVDLIDMD